MVNPSTIPPRTRGLGHLHDGSGPENTDPWPTVPQTQLRISGYAHGVNDSSDITCSSYGQ